MSAQPQHGLAPQEVPTTVEDAVRPLLESEGYDLILVEFVPASHILRLYVDKPDAPGGVGIQDCTQVSRWVSDLLDAQGLTDRIAGSFNLEVSSPGLDRPLVRPRDFCRFVGRQARLTTHPGAVSAQPSRRRFSGRLVAAGQGADEGIEIEVDGESFSIRYGMIEQARLVPEL